MIFITVIFLLLSSISFAKENVDSTQVQTPSIPYPNGGIYLERGLAGAFLGGKHRNFGDKQSLYQWQGDLSYYYTPHFSGGVSFKITAGEPSDTTAKIVNRYFVQCRLHQKFKSFAVFVGPQIGMENLNIIKGNIPDSLTPNAIKNPIQPISPSTKPSVGLDFGVGWKFSRYAGLTYGNSLEFSFIGEDGKENTLNLHFNPGLAVDILSFSKSLRKLVKAMYVIAELQDGTLLNERYTHNRDRSIIVGIDLAF